MTIHTKQKEVDRNFEAFKLMKSELMNSDAGRFALLHNAELIACFDTYRDAQLVGGELFEKKFSPCRRFPTNL